MLNIALVTPHQQLRTRITSNPTKLRSIAFLPGSARNFSRQGLDAVAARPLECHSPSPVFTDRSKGSEWAICREEHFQCPLWGTECSRAMNELSVRAATPEVAVAQLQMNRVGDLRVYRPSVASSTNPRSLPRGSGCRAPCGSGSSPRRSWATSRIGRCPASTTTAAGKAPWSRST